jgi:RimJ/RimL family protein N-acetyltransferase
MPNMTTIRTNRLELRPVSPEIAAAVIADDLAVLTAAPVTGSALKIGDGWPHEDTRDGLGGVAHGTDAWLVTLDGVVIGDCGTHGPADEAGDIELGYGLAEPFRGRGLGTEVAVGLTEHLRRLPGVRRVVANEVLADNLPSRRALERAGFACLREADGLSWYALTA